ncbi:MAG: hypothetical protein IJU02_07260 [Lachnospiraceae bacterium]|nr:hypothetical protein [Lachnospiraceae bacterium]
MDEDYKRLAFQLGLPVDVIKKVYKSYWLFIKETINKLPFKEDLSREDFVKLKTSFNLPHLGKLYCNYDRWKAVKEIYDDKYKKSKANV